MENPNLKLSAAYRIPGYKLDGNGRSTWTYYEVPLIGSGPMSALSARQDAMSWGLAYNQNSPKPYNVSEMHKTNQMGIVWVMSGHLETTIQNGEMRRRCAGEGNFVNGACLHHSTMRSTVPTTTLSLNLTKAVANSYTFK